MALPAACMGFAFPSLYSSSSSPHKLMLFHSHLLGSDQLSAALFCPGKGNLGQDFASEVFSLGLHGAVRKQTGSLPF